MLILKGHTASRGVWCLSFSPDGQRLLSSGNDETARLWDLAAGTHRVVRKNARNSTFVLFATALSPDGRTMAFQESNLLTLVRIDDDAVVWRNRELGVWGVRHLCFSPDGRWLATGGSVTKLVDVETGRCVRMKGHQGLVEAIAFSPDGRALALGHLPKRDRHENGYWIQLRKIPSGGSSRLEGHTAPCTNLSFSPDGRYLAGSCCQSLNVWEVESGVIVSRMKFDRLHFQGVAFTPDGRYLAAVRNDCTARFWDTTTWKQAVAFDWEIGPLVSLAIAPDGLRAAAGSKRGKIIVWDIDF